MQQNTTQLKLQLDINPVDDNFLLQPTIELEPEHIAKLTRKSYFFYVLQLRSGVTQSYLKTLISTILQSIQQIVQKGIAGISFVINGEHYPVKNLTFGSVKQMLSGIMVIANRDDYHDTLVKTRHSIQNVANKLQETKISLIFFFSFIEIDHSLGLKKRSYIDYLNEHEDICDEQVQRLSKTIKKYTDQCKTYIVSLDKNGYEQEDYSLSDTGLMNKINLLVGNYGSTIFRCYSSKQIYESFQKINSLLLNEIYSFDLIFPVIAFKDLQKKTLECHMTCNDMAEFKISSSIFIHKCFYDSERINNGEIYAKTNKNIQAKLGKIFLKVLPNYKQLNLLELLTARTQLYGEQLNKISYKLSQEIVRYKRKYESGKSYLIMIINQQLLLQLRDRIYQIYDISKEIFEGIQTSSSKNKHTLFQYYNQLKYKIDYIQEVLLSIFKKRLGGSEIGKLSQLINLSSITKSIKNRLIRRINSNPYLLDQVYRQVQEVVDGGKIDFLDVQVNSQYIRKNLGNCVLSGYNFVKAMIQYDALGIAFQIQRPQSAIMDPGRIKIRQVSPYMMRTSQFFQKFIYKINYTPMITVITLGFCKICKKNKCNKHPSQLTRNIEQVQVIKYKTQVQKNSEIRWRGTNSNENDRRNQQFGEQMDFSQTKIVYKNQQKTWESKQIKSYNNYQSDCECCRWSQAFIYYSNLSDNIKKQAKQVDFLREKGDLDRNNYQQRCDYTDRTGTIPTVLGFMPLFLTKQHWKIAKLLMKPSLGWTAAGEPLGYLFSQYQTIPFILLASIIRSCKQKDYEIQQELKKGEKCNNIKSLNILQTRINQLKQKKQRMEYIKQSVQITCQQILLQLSGQYYEIKFIQTIKGQYLNYNNPLNRTVDIISNNSAFLAQYYCLVHSGIIQKPREEQFHEFFVRLIEQQLRRQTDGWNQQQTQDKFIDKLLNVQSSAIKHWDYEIVGGQEYLQKFHSAFQGQKIQKSYVQMQKQQLQMLLRKQGKFNDSQRLILIQYKRLYQNRVLWFWYIRFLIYGQRQRPYIHKWKCLGLNNSYMLFTLIIQNKKQRKNWKRRQAIQANQYTDPFDYEAARYFLQDQFLTLRNKKEGQVVKRQNRLVCERAAEIFAYTGNLQEAAGTLVGFHHNSIRPFYEELLTGKAIRIDQKLKMLLLGSYKQVKLFSGWKMNRARFLKLSYRYPMQFLRFKYMF